MKTLTTHPDNKNGSVIIIAMILGLSLAALAGGYIALTTQSMKLTQRTFYQNTAFNLAESGAEYAVWCMKNDWTLPSNAWTGDTTTKTYIGSVGSPIFTDSQGAKGFFKIRVTNADSSNPTVIAEGIVVPSQGQSVSKQIRVRLSNGGLFDNGLVADAITLNGGELDSYRSSTGNPATAAREYDLTVASTTLDIGDISIGTAADIYGRVAIAPSEESSSADFIDSIQGQILGPDTDSSDPGVIQNGSNLVDTNRIAYDFTADLPDAEVPPVGGSTVVYTALPAANVLDLIVIGDPTGTTTARYNLTSVSIPNGKTLMIVGPVEFNVSTSFSVAGGGALVVLDGTTTVAKKVGSVTYIGSYTGDGEAKLYVKGDISISGNGSINAPYKPAALQIYGTLNEAEYESGLRQNISIGGNGNLTAALYAPNSDIVMNGGGSSGYFAGAAVGQSVRINGNGYRFRYDKDLQDLSLANSYKVSGWAELLNPADKYSFGG
jgi:hypothetical protein